MSSKSMKMATIISFNNTRLQRTASHRHYAPKNGGWILSKKLHNLTKAMDQTLHEKPNAHSLSREAEDEEPMAPFLKLFSHADWVDVMLVALGTAGAVLQGLAKPVSFLFAGKALYAFAEVPSNNTSAMSHAMREAIPYVFMNTALLVPGGFLEIWNCWTHISERRVERLKSTFLEATIDQRVGIRDKDIMSVKILEDFKGDVNDIENAVGQKMGHFISNATTFIAGIIVAFISCWELAVAVTILTVPLVMITGMIQYYVLMNVNKERENLYSEAASIVQQTVSQIRSVLSCIGEKRSCQSFLEALDKVSALSRRAGFVKGLALGCMNAVINCSWAFLIWLGATMVIAGRSQGTRMLTAVLCILFGGISLGIAAPHLQRLKKGRVAVFKILDTGKRSRQTGKETDGTIPVNVQGSIVFQDVCFAYPSRLDKQVLTDISMQVLPGTTVALVGSSGSGKSTILSMISRVHDPTRGEIKLDDHDLRDLDMKWLKAQVGYIGEPILFAGTIRENIIMENKDAKIEDVEKVADIVNASFINELPQRYETQVGERGSQLSEGQKQKIALARALLKNPPILLIDQATIDLDAISDLLIGRTNIVVAHHLFSTVCNADMIVVVEGGEIVEMGKHAELFQKSGHYAKLLISLQKKSNLKVLRKKTTRNMSESLVALASSSPPWASPFSLGYLLRNLTTIASSKIPVAELQIEEGHSKKQQSSLKRVLMNMKPVELQEMLLGSVGAFLSATVGPAFSLLVIKIGVSYYDSNPNKHINFWSGIFATSGLLAIFSHTLHHYYFEVVGQRLTKKLQNKLYSVILRKEVSWFDQERNRSEALSSQIIKDAGILKECIADHLCMLVQCTVSIMAALIFIPAVNWKMAFQSWWALPWHLVASFLQANSAASFSGDAGEVMLKRIGDFASDVAMTNQRFETLSIQDKPLETAMKGFNMSTMKERIKSGFFNRLALYFWQGGHAVAIFYGSLLVQNKQEAFVNNMKAYQVFSSIVPSLTEILTILPALKKADQGLGKVLCILDDSSSLEMDSRDQMKLKKIKGGITFEGVGFSYPARPEVTVLRNLNLNISSGKTLALVGMNGVGKSSVIALMQRLYEPCYGRILFDYQDMRLLDGRWLRRQIVVVEEGTLFLKGSIRENICYGIEGVPMVEETVMEAAKVANLHEVVCGLKDGYGAEVGVLSGGEKHRVVIARAMAKVMAGGAVVVVLEAGALLRCGLDMEAMEQALEMVVKERHCTCMVVANRLTRLVKQADTIAVMEKGGIVEEGTHESLMQNQTSLYANMVATTTMVAA